MRHFTPVMDFDLGETIDLLRDTVGRFAATEIAPRAAKPRTCGASWARSAPSASRSIRPMAALASVIWRR
jgi:hypothetical protein